MPHLTLSDIVKRRFIYCVNRHGYSVRALVMQIGVPPGELCRVVAGQKLEHLPLHTYAQIARWLNMQFANVTALAGVSLKLADLVHLGMEMRGHQPTSAADQQIAAQEADISVAVFRRALHGYHNFRPSIRTCDRLAAWLAWTGLDSADIAQAAGMMVRYRSDNRRITITPTAENLIRAYPCACGRPGCFVPAHVPSPNGPRRKWRSDACRMWAKRRAEQTVFGRAQTRKSPAAALPHPTPIVRFIMINERYVPVRF
jgi:hypothetical protein